MVPQLPNIATVIYLRPVSVPGNASGKATVKEAQILKISTRAASMSEYLGRLILHLGQFVDQ